MIINKYFFVLIFTISILYILYTLSKHLNLLDLPENRKVHNKPTPFVGGLIIFFSIIFSSILFEYNYFFNYLIYTSSLIIIIGLIDDKYNLSPYTRLFFQFTTSFIMFGSGLIISNLGEYEFVGLINLYVFSYLFTAFSIVLIINAFNFIDGIDGLCGGMFVTSLILILVFSFFEIGNSIFYYSFINNLILITVIFLIFNIFSNRLKIFLGDSGSMLLGLLLGWLIVYYTSEEKNFHPVLALWVISYPIYDFLTVFSRRLFYERKNPMLSDKYHFHHLLLRIFSSHKKVSLILNIFAICFGIFGLIIFEYFGSIICLISFILILFLYNLLYYKLFNIQKKT